MADTAAEAVAAALAAEDLAEAALVDIAEAVDLAAVRVRAALGVLLITTIITTITDISGAPVGVGIEEAAGITAPEVARSICRQSYFW